jgi:enoyl-[acyl-carrier protein] reductase I
MTSEVKKGNLLEGKKGIILGLANKKSISWGIAEALHAQGADLAFTYASDSLKKRVGPLAESLGSNIVLPCNVLDYDSIDAVFAELEKCWGKLDFVVHAIAFADKDELNGRYIDTSIENFSNAMEISCYSFTAIAKAAAPLMKDGGSMITLTYDGANRVVPHYNVMGVCKAALEASVRYLAEDLGKDGIRVNSVSAGPIKTLAASGISDFNYILRWNEYNSPLRRNTTIQDVGGTAVYLLSDLGSGTTGTNVMVDSGYHIVGMKAEDAPDITSPNNSTK